MDAVFALKHKNKAVITAIARAVSTLLAVLAVLAGAVVSGCSTTVRGNASGDAGAAVEDFTGIPEVPVAVAPGAMAVENRKAAIDYSNADDGYVMVRFHEQVNRQIRALVTVPDGTQYIFRLDPGGDYAVLPLSSGNGEYTIDVLEEVDNQLYALALTATIFVALNDEFAPFLRPNQYVNYSRSSAAVRKAAGLTEGIFDEMEKIAAIYNFVITSVTYDDYLAATVESGYIPDVDAVMESGKGICFDFAALMTAMLRSQGIPTKMVLGYTGEAYHAWVSVFAGEMGWVDNMFFFDGWGWQIMDPTFAAGGLSDEIVEYIGNPANYNALYQY